MYCIRSATSYLFRASLGYYFMNFFERWYFSLLNIIIEWLSLYSLHCKFAPQSSSQHWQIFCKNVNNTFQIENSGNSKTDFFLKPILANISGETSIFMSLWNLHWIYGLNSASNLHNFYIKMSQNMLNYVWFDGILDPWFWGSLY